MVNNGCPGWIYDSYSFITPIPDSSLPTYPAIRAGNIFVALPNFWMSSPICETFFVLHNSIPIKQISIYLLSLACILVDIINDPISSISNLHHSKITVLELFALLGPPIHLQTLWLLHYYSIPIVTGTPTLQLNFYPCHCTKIASHQVTNYIMQNCDIG